MHAVNATTPFSHEVALQNISFKNTLLASRNLPKHASTTHI